MPDPFEKPDPLEKLLRDASRASVGIIEKLTEGTSGSVRAMLLEISRSFATPGYTVGQLKEKLGVTFLQLRRFHAAVGLNPGRLIRECRMETALRLLRDSLLGVEEIAILIGYDSKRGFERLCQRWCGLSPADLRETLRPIKGELSKLPDDVFSWYFWERYRFGTLSDDELRVVIEYLERRLGV